MTCAKRFSIVMVFISTMLVSVQGNISKCRSVQTACLHLGNWMSDLFCDRLCILKGYPVSDCTVNSNCLETVTRYSCRCSRKAGKGVAESFDFDGDRLTTA